MSERRPTRLSEGDPHPAAAALAAASGGPVVIAAASHGPNLLVRTLGYVFIGWWLSGIVAAGAWLLQLTIVGIPLAFMIFNRLPSVMTLRPRTYRTTVELREGVVYQTDARVPQRAFWKRALYFLLVGWWFSATWIAAAWLIGLLVITLPLVVMMLNRLPAVTTLRRF